MRAFVVGMVLLCGIAQGAEPAQNQQLDGFRGIPWGTELKTVSGMKEIGQRSPELVWYDREGDKLLFGDATLSRISYLAYKGRLFQVSLSAWCTNNQKLAVSAIATFGKMHKVQDPKSLGLYWPQNLEGPITGTEMQGGKIDKTFIALIEGWAFWHPINGEISATSLYFISYDMAKAMQENAERTAPARAGDF